MQPVTAADAFVSAAAVATDDGGRDATQRLTVVADDGVVRGVVEGAVGRELVHPFGITVDLRSALHEVKTTVLSTIFKTVYETFSFSHKQTNVE